jgi:hypothetical protein
MTAGNVTRPSLDANKYDFVVDAKRGEFARTMSAA